MTDTINQIARTQARNRRYRNKHRRIDYAPSPEVLSIINAWRARKLDNCMAGVLDKLLVAGHRALQAQQGISGNGHGTVLPANPHITLSFQPAGIQPVSTAQAVCETARMTVHPGAATDAAFASLAGD